MKRLLFALALVASACGGPDIPRMPPLSIGSGGVRMMDDAKTPVEAYENAYSSMTGCHNRVRQGLGIGTQRNFLDAAAALEEIADSLRVMRALVPDDSKAPYDPYIKTYADLATDVGRRRPPANWQTVIDQGEREIKSKFAFTTAPIVKEWPPGMGTNANVVPPATGPAEADPIPPAPPAPVAVVPLRLAFKAWKQSHADLAAAFDAGKDATPAYEDVRGAITAMKDGLPAARHAKLNLMLAVYEQQHAETKGFTAVPPHGTKALILKQLDVVKETLATEYDPDRK
jgi:hypothetical protein